ncbi:MAG: hypothetical protein QNJ46_25640 [Leptolyngbyaceae cyanobacterium MO_188.B28]|nr:hypothetical protein [Leptolyngbyaceae cyanobacterium MO_188.B28]
MQIKPIRLFALSLATLSISTASLIQTYKTHPIKPAIASSEAPLPSIGDQAEDPRQKTGDLLTQDAVIPEQTYEIHIVRPSEVGERYRLSTKGSSSIRSKVLLDNQIVNNEGEESTLDLVADVTILEVNDTQQPTSAELNVIQSRLLQNNAESIPFSEGTNILATVENEETVFKINGEKIEGGLEEILSNAIAFLSKDNSNDNELFGTPTTKKIGETWNINTEAVADFLGDINSQDISGSVTLSKVEDGFLFLNSLITISNMLSSEFPPDKFTVEQDEFFVKFSTRLPIDLSNKDRDVDMNFSGSATANFRENPQMKVLVIFEERSSYQVRDME